MSREIELEDYTKSQLIDKVVVLEQIVKKTNYWTLYNDYYLKNKINNNNT